MAGSLETAGLASADTEQREGLSGKGLRRAGGGGAGVNQPLYRHLQGGHEQNQKSGFLFS